MPQKKRRTPRMTYREFLVHLRKVRDGRWKLSRDGLLRMLRILESGYGYEVDCPITAVCRRLKRGNYHVTEYEIAAQRLGLSKARMIARAADDPSTPLTDEECIIRDDLLRACGLLKKPRASRRAKT